MLNARRLHGPEYIVSVSQSRTLAFNDKSYCAFRWDVSICFCTKGSTATMERAHLIGREEAEVSWPTASSVSIRNKGCYNLPDVDVHRAHNGSLTLAVTDSTES